MLLNVSVTVTVFSSSVVGVLKVKPAVPVVAPCGVENVALFQVAVAVLRPAAGLGAVV